MLAYIYMNIIIMISYLSVSFAVLVLSLVDVSVGENSFTESVSLPCVVSVSLVLLQQPKTRQSVRIRCLNTVRTAVHLPHDDPICPSAVHLSRPLTPSVSRSSLDPSDSVSDIIKCRRFFLVVGKNKNKK